MTKLTASPVWKALRSHHEAFRLTTSELFTQSSQRFKHFSREACGLLFDYSKQRVTHQTLQLLIALAEQQEVGLWRAAMYRGESINDTEGRPVLHMALRNRSATSIYVDGQDVMPTIKDVLERMERLVEDVHEGRWLGGDGRRITDVISLGIGGSHVGPEMVTRALRPFHHHSVRVHFVSNVDGGHLRSVLERVVPETTLVLVISKTFKTLETLVNAASVREWFVTRGCSKTLERHFIAVSANVEEALSFGIKYEHIFPFWDWVGGRFSLWSAVGLPVALATGMGHFKECLEGAYLMDQHFLTAPYLSNLPILMGLIGVWNINFCCAKGHAVLPYDQNLERFIPYLQQLEMESNGKSVGRDGEVIDYDTAPIIFGEPGTNGQHTFYQLLQQGTQTIACDFLVGVRSLEPLLGPYGSHHDILLANCLGQTQGLLQGSSKQQQNLLPLYQRTLGNCPVTMLVYERLTPRTLGTLLALYEHKVFVQGVLWNINSFDQWGVEQGKRLTQHLIADIKVDTMSQVAGEYDGSTRALLHWLKSFSS